GACERGHWDFVRAAGRARFYQIRRPRPLVAATLSVPPKLLVASSNPGKLAEFRTLASAAPSVFAVSLDLVPRFSEYAAFPESEPRLAENAAGKALHYSRFADLPVLADDSGLFVNALDGRPGVHSARHAGPGASDAQRISKLLADLKDSR